MSRKTLNGILLGTFVLAGSAFMPALGQAGLSASQVVSRLMMGYQTSDFKAIFDVSYLHQHQIQLIKGQNPQVTWGRLIQEYYESARQRFGAPVQDPKGPLTSMFAGLQAMGQSVFESPEDPATTIIRSFFHARPKWTILEARTLGSQSLVYVEVIFSSPDLSPLYQEGLLKRAILQVRLDPQGLFYSAKVVPRSDGYWERVPLKIVSIQWVTVLRGDFSFGYDILGGQAPYVSDTRCGAIRLESSPRQVFTPQNASVHGSPLEDPKPTINITGPAFPDNLFPLGCVATVRDSVGQTDTVSFGVPAMYSDGWAPYCWIREPWYSWGQGRPIPRSGCTLVRALGPGQTSTSPVAGSTGSSAAPLLAPCSTAKAASYKLQLDKSVYTVRKLPTPGTTDSPIFFDSTNRPVSDLATARRLAVAAWTVNNVVLDSGYRLRKRSDEVASLLETAAALKKYEIVQDELVRLSVEALAATVSDGRTLGGSLGWAVKQGAVAQVKDPRTYLLLLTSGSLVRSMQDFQSMESEMKKLDASSYDVVRLEQVESLYREGAGLLQTFRPVAVAMMPEHWTDLVDEALSSMGSQVLSVLESLPEAASPAQFVDALWSKVGQVQAAGNLQLLAQNAKLARELAAANNRMFDRWARQALSVCGRSPASLPVSGATFLDELNGSSIGEAHGIQWIQGLEHHGAIFTAANSSRIEYPTQIPNEGTLEFLIKVDSGYQYSNYAFTRNLDTAVIFSTDVQGGDVTWPGTTKLSVSRNGDISLWMATAKYNQPPPDATVAHGTEFRFGEWHMIGISYGSQGQFIMVDTRVVASAPNRTQTLGRAGNHQTPLDVPTIGETISHFWTRHQYEGGFEGVLARFIVSTKQQDWFWNTE